MSLNGLIFSAYTQVYISGSNAKGQLGVAEEEVGKFVERVVLH